MNIDQMIKEVQLSGEDLVKFESDIKEHRSTYIKFHSKNVKDKEKVRGLLLDLYIMRFKLNLSTTEMGEYFGLDFRSIQCKLKKYGWNRDKYEAQSIAKTKRNYKQIRSKSIETMIRNNTFATGSEVENYIRQIVNQSLTGKLNCEVIVGLNNKTILNGLEIDIPIVIFNNEKVFKYALEINGNYWHRNEVYEKRKESAINKTDYKYLVITITGSLTNSKSKIDKDIENTVNQILEEVNNTSFFIAKS